MVESGRVPGKGRIRASTGKRQNPCEFQKTFPYSTEKGSTLLEYRKKVESVRVSRNCPDEYRNRVESV